MEYFLPPSLKKDGEDIVSYLSRKAQYYSKRVTIAKNKSNCEKLKSANVWYSGALEKLLKTDKLGMLEGTSNAKRTIQMCFPGIQMTTSDIMLMYNGYKAMIEEE